MFTEAQRANVRHLHKHEKELDMSLSKLGKDLDMMEGGAHASELARVKPRKIMIVSLLQLIVCMIIKCCNMPWLFWLCKHDPPYLQGRGQ